MTSDQKRIVWALVGGGVVFGFTFTLGAAVAFSLGGFINGLLRAVFS